MYPSLSDEKDKTNLLDVGHGSQRSKDAEGPQRRHIQIICAMQCIKDHAGHTFQDHNKVHPESREVHEENVRSQRVTEYHCTGLDERSTTLLDIVSASFVLK